MEPRIIQLEEQKLVGLYSQMSLVENSTTDLWKRFRKRSGRIQFRTSENFISLQHYPSGYFEAFKPSNTFVKWACVAVNRLECIPVDLDTMILTGGLYAVFDHQGSSADSQIFQYIYGEWIPNSKYHTADRPHFEVLGADYKVDDHTAKEEIWIPIQHA